MIYVHLYSHPTHNGNCNYVTDIGREGGDMVNIGLTKETLPFFETIHIHVRSHILRHMLKLEQTKMGGVVTIGSRISRQTIHIYVLSRSYILNPGKQIYLVAAQKLKNPIMPSE